MPSPFPTILVPTPEVGPQGSFGDLLNNFITWSIAIGALITLLFILMGGFNYVTAGDDEKKAEGARKTITNGVIGLVIIGAAFIIWRLVVSILSLDTIFGGTGSGGAAVPACTNVTGLSAYGIPDKCYTAADVTTACGAITLAHCSSATTAEKAIINTYCPGKC